MTHTAADVRPEPNHQRKAAVAHGGVLDHAGHVKIEPIADFDLDRTIFNTLKGRAARYIMRTRIGNEIHWDKAASERVEQDYDAATADLELPPVDPALMAFLVDECDFDVEHADGSFLDHLYFCYEYGVKHYPERSALPLLLHSVLGTGTNTFAMEASKIDALRGLLSDFDWRQTEAFPSVLRLLYVGELREQLRANADRIGTLKAVRMHRVIDNAPIEMSAEDFWVALNYQLVHLVDFIPVANWAARMSDTSFIVFRDLYDLLGTLGQREASVAYTPPSPGTRAQGDAGGLGSKLVHAIPVGLAARLAAKSVREFSAAIGHDLSFELVWE